LADPPWNVAPVPLDFGAAFLSSSPHPTVSATEVRAAINTDFAAFMAIPSDGFHFEDIEEFYSK
jgi:hypothetical protein